MAQADQQLDYFEVAQYCGQVKRGVALVVKVGVM